ncbi:FAD-dependent oxidoreductase, partial [Sedimentitalea sp. JM2-8]
NIPKLLPQSFEEASETKYQGGHFWTPITPIQGSNLHAGSHANGGLVTPSHAAPWNSPGIFRTLLSSLNDETAALYLKASAIPSYFFWGLQFLRNSTPARYYRTIERNSRLAHYSLGVLNDLTKELDLRFDGERRGTIMFYRNQSAFDRVKRINEYVANSGVHVAQCSAEDLVRLEPALGDIEDKLCGGFYYPGDQHGDAYLYCRALADKLTSNGVDFRFGQSVTGFETSGRRVTGIVTDRERFDTDAVVLATGFWSAMLGRQLRLRLPIKPVKGYSITYDISSVNIRPAIPVVDDELHIGLTPLGDRIRFVGTAEFSGYSPDINPKRIESLRRAALATYPGMASIVNDAEPITIWCNHRPMTPDCLPLVGQTGLENVYLNTGHGYLGWTTASGTSRAVADLIVGRDTSLALDDYNISRF